MFGDVQHTIRDAQYRDALSKINESPPEKVFPKPSEVEYDDFLEKLTINLESVLDSPVGVYFLKEYLNNFLNVTIIVDFLIQYYRINTLEEIEEIELKDLVFLADELPAPYKADVLRINQQLKIMEKGDGEEYTGLEANDLVVDNQADPYLVSTHFPDVKKKTLLTTATNRVFSKIRMSKGVENTGIRTVSFGGTKKKSEFNKSDARVSAPKKMKNKIMGMLTTRNNKIVSAVDFEVQEEGRPKLPEDTDLIGSDGEDEVEDIRTDEGDMLLRHSIRNAKDILLRLFEKLGSKLETKAKNLFTSFKESEEYQRMVEAWWWAEQPPTPADFRKFRMLGRGAFGVVSGVKHKYTGQLVAMKMMNKRLVKGKRAWPLVHAEKEVLQLLGDSPCSFTIWLKYAFQDTEYFYMAIPLCTGGDLSYHLSASGNFSIERVRFYAAEIFEGLSHLHHLGIIYRDLKPENVILDSEGHCRISDMGLAAVTNGQRIKSKAGTPGYWAPEVLVKLFYSYPVDIWSLGVVVFEMVLGVCPFSRSNTGMDRDKATRYWPIKYPEYIKPGTAGDEQIRFPDDLRALLKGLLKRRASKRFTEQTIRDHPFFCKYNWEELRNRLIKPPFIPADNKVNAGAAKQLEERGNEKEFKKVELTAQDDIKGFDYISKYAHELDCVNVMHLQKSRPELMPIKRVKRANSRRPTNIYKSLRNISTSKSKSGDCAIM